MNFIFQFGEFTVAESSGFWKTFLPLVAPSVALIIYFLSQRAALRKEQVQKANTENNKLRYLHFLVEDSFRPLETYREEVAKIKTIFSKNPFIIPDMVRNPPHSLNTIANKINQEEYYLASINRIDEDISELLQVYNALYSNYVGGIKHFDENFPKLITEKQNYNSALLDLITNINHYLKSTIPNELVDVDKGIYHQIDDLINVIPDNPNHNSKWMNESKNVLLLPFRDIISTGSFETYEYLLKQVQEVINKCDFIMHT